MLTEEELKAIIRKLVAEEEPVDVAMFLGAYLFSSTEHIVRLEERIEKLERMFAGHLERHSGGWRPD